MYGAYLLKGEGREDKTGAGEGGRGKEESWTDADSTARRCAFRCTHRISSISCLAVSIGCHHWTTRNHRNWERSACYISQHAKSAEGRPSAAKIRPAKGAQLVSGELLHFMKNNFLDLILERNMTISLKLFNIINVAEAHISRWIRDTAARRHLESGIFGIRAPRARAGGTRKTRESTDWSARSPSRSHCAHRWAHFKSHSTSGCVYESNILF